MLKKLFMDYSPKEMFAPNNPGIFVEILWKAESDIRSSSLLSVVCWEGTSELPTLHLWDRECAVRTDWRNFLEADLGSGSITETSVWDQDNLLAQSA